MVKPGKRFTNTMKNGEGNMTFKPVVLKVEPNQWFDRLGSLCFKGLFDGQT